MLIVSDTGPLRYLIEIEAVTVLPKLFVSGIVTTQTVLDELKAPHFPTSVKDWAASIPDWLKIEQPDRIDFLDQLDAGEASAISLAVQRKADAVLIDERDGTDLARKSGLQTLGTLAVLHAAGIAGLVDFHQAIRRLTEHTKFHHSRRLIEQVIIDYNEALLHARQRPTGQP